MCMTQNERTVCQEPHARATRLIHESSLFPFSHLRNAMTGAGGNPLSSAVSLPPPLLPPPPTPQPLQSASPPPPTPTPVSSSFFFLLFFVRGAPEGGVDSICPDSWANIDPARRGQTIFCIIFIFPCWAIAREDCLVNSQVLSFD